MEEESDSRKINNSFLRDHNYATEGIWKIELNLILTYINDGDGGGGGLLYKTLLYMNVLLEHWALVLFGALMILRFCDLKVLHSYSVLEPRCFSCFYGLRRTIYRPCISLSSGFRCYYGAVAIEI